MKGHGSVHQQHSLTIKPKSLEELKHLLWDQDGDWWWCGLDLVYTDSGPCRRHSASYCKPQCCLSPWSHPHTCRGEGEFIQRIKTKELCFLLPNVTQHTQLFLACLVPFSMTIVKHYILISGYLGSLFNPVAFVLTSVYHPCELQIQEKHCGCRYQDIRQQMGHSTVQCPDQLQPLGRTNADVFIKIL